VIMCLKQGANDLHMVQLKPLSPHHLRIGHTRLTHSYLIDHTDPPECTNCHQQLSVKHILTECLSYNQARQQRCLYNNLKDIFNHSPTNNILNFIKNTNLHDKL